MTVAAAEALDRGVLPWLFATAVATTLPHAEHQPVWLLLVSLAIATGSAWLHARGRPLPGRWWLLLLVVLGCSAVLTEYRTILGRDAGVGMLVLFMAMKTLELKSRRDAFTIVLLGYFLLLTHYFYSQSIPTGLWLLASCILVTATLVRLNGGSAVTPSAALRLAGLMTAQALPFLLIFYVLFPRVSGPLWGLPKDAHSGQSGLPEQMSPGSIADLVLNSAIAFRVRFEGAPPPHQRLYWRGPVMEWFDGRTWSHRPAGTQAAIVTARGSTVHYETTLEPHNQRWLLALDAPTSVPSGAELTPTLSVIVREPVTQRLRLSFAAAPEFAYNLDESPSALERNRNLPGGSNPRTRALVSQWLASDSRPGSIVAKALEFFRSESFAYTLRPPLLGEQPVDEFLFSARRGFCEHYASAFVVLMRAAGIPARVVGGYQGGEMNPVDGYMVVRQSDAHAWAEVWLAGQGWVRVDPTSVVSPARVEEGIAQAIPAGEPLPALVQLDAAWLRAARFRWEALNNAWNQMVLGYNPERQRELLSRLGWPDADWRNLTALLAGISGVVLLAVAGWALYRRPRQDPAQRLWQKALARMRRAGLTTPPWESPLTLGRRVAAERPEVGVIAQDLAAAYCDIRYGGRTERMNDLRQAVAALRLWRTK